MGTQWALNKAGYFWGGLSYRNPQGLKYKVEHEQTISLGFFWEVKIHFRDWRSCKLHASLSHKALSRHRLTSRSMCMKPCVTICFRLPLVSKSPHNNCAGKSRAWISLVWKVPPKYWRLSIPVPFPTGTPFTCSLFFFALKHYPDPLGCLVEWPSLQY